MFSGSVSKDASKPLCPVCVGVEADDSFDKIEETRALLDETKFGTNPCRDAGVCIASEREHVASLICRNIFCDNGVAHHEDGRRWVRGCAQGGQVELEASLLPTAT